MNFDAYLTRQCGPVGRTRGRASQKIIVLVMEIWAKMEANQAKTRASASQPQKPEVSSSRNQHEKSAFPSAWPPPFRLETTERLSWQRDYHLPLNFYCKRLARKIDNVWGGRWQLGDGWHVRNLCKISYLQQCLHFGRWWRKQDRIVKEVGLFTNGARNLANNNFIKRKRHSAQERIRQLLLINSH